jgi:hypothetical protein
VPQATPPDSRDTFLVVGETPVARRVCATLADASRARHVRHLVTPGDAELASALSEQVTAAAVLVRDDVIALRCALALAHLDPTLPLIVTIFDRTISGQLRTFLPQALVISPADLAVPSLAGPCLDAELLASFLDADGTVRVRSDDQGCLTEYRSARRRAVSARASSQHCDRTTGTTTSGPGCS